MPKATVSEEIAPVEAAEAPEEEAPEAVPEVPAEEVVPVKKPRAKPKAKAVRRNAPPPHQEA